MTFSITAKCEKTGQFGVAVSTAVPGVGGLCPFAKAGVGAIASQSFVNPYIGINGLKYLEQGLSAQEVADKVLAEDPLPEQRQFSIVDKDGNAVSHSGDQCDTWYGHKTGENYAVAGNMLVDENTVEAAAKAFEKNADLTLSERLLCALEAGQAAGGDKRGRQSAALYVVHEEDYAFCDLRVDEHIDPVKELRRVYEVAQEQLAPLVAMLPTKKHPAGRFDFDHSRELGLLQDDK